LDEKTLLNYQQNGFGYLFSLTLTLCRRKDY